MKLRCTGFFLLALLVCGGLTAQSRSATVREGKIESVGHGHIRRLTFQGFCDFDSLSERKRKHLTEVTSLSWSNVVAPVLSDYVPLEQIKNAELNEVTNDWCPLSYMYFAPFPQEVLQMHALERFSEMNVVFIPEEIVQLKNLHYLEFESRNYHQMQFLPLTIGLLPELDTFSVNEGCDWFTAELMFYRICNKDLKIVSRETLNRPGEQYYEYTLPEIYYDTLLFSWTHHLMIYFDKAHTKLMMDGNLVNGMPHGDWMIYNEKGAVKEERHYDHGVAIGTWKSNLWTGAGLQQQIVFSDSGYVLNNYVGNSEAQCLIVRNNLQEKFSCFSWSMYPGLSAPDTTRWLQETTFDTNGRILLYVSRSFGEVVERHVFINNYRRAEDHEGQCDCPEPKPFLPLRVIYDQTGGIVTYECACDKK